MTPIERVAQEWAESEYEFSTGDGGVNFVTHWMPLPEPPKGGR